MATNWTKVQTAAVRDFIQRLEVGDRITILVEQDCMLPVKAEGGLTLWFDRKIVSFIPMKKATD